MTSESNLIWSLSYGSLVRGKSINEHLDRYEEVERDPENKNTIKGIKATQKVAKKKGGGKKK